jgi:Na+/H+-dicarboxylate symporter
MLQIIVFAVLFGMALTMSGGAGKRWVALFNDLNDIILRLVMMLIALAPYGVFCLLARVFAAEGLGAIGPLAAYFALVLGVLFAHALLTYPLMLRLLARVDPLVFFRKMRPPLALAFSTASSGATLPVTLETVEHRLGVDNSIASFTVPLGATINMDGTAIMQGVATGFIAQAYGIDLGVGDFLTVVLTATLASIGTAAVPGVGLVMLAMVLRQVGLPVEGIGLIIGVDRLLDMVRTAVNITGDATVSCIVARSEGKFDESIFAATTDG